MAMVQFSMKIKSEILDAMIRAVDIGKEKNINAAANNGLAKAYNVKLQTKPKKEKK